MSQDGARVALPTLRDARGALTVLDPRLHLPFEVRWVYWITDVPAGTERGHHAHRTLSELLVPVTGGLNVTTDDGSRRQSHALRAPGTGLLLPAGTWFEMEDFLPGTALLVLASGTYDEKDNIRDYAEFKAWGRRRGK